MFTVVMSNVAVILVYMFLGWAVCKAGKAVPAHAKSMSGILLYILSPAMIINSFLQIDFSVDNLLKIGKFFIVTFVIQTLFLIILYALFNKKYDDAKYRIMSVGAVMGNVGFFGMPVISGIFPNEPIVVCYSTMYVMSMNLLAFTMGVFLITNDKRHISIKSALINPTSISIFIALPMYILGVKLTGLVGNSVGLLAKMVTPVCMFILGIRLSTESFKDVFGRGFVYLSCAFKLVIFPIFAFMCVKWLPFLDDVAKISVFVLSAAPSAAVIESLAELHECEQELSANVVLLATILSIVTIPTLLFLLAR